MAVSSRRVNYTKQTLRKSLVDLLQHKKFDAITISELCEKANVNRSTFYAHYHNIAEILNEIVDDVKNYIVNNFIQAYVDPASLYVPEVITTFLEYIKDNVEVFKVLLGDEGFFMFSTKITEVIINNLHPKQSFYSIMYFVCGFMGSIRSWIFSGMPDTIPMISKQLSKIYIHHLNVN